MPTGDIFDPQTDIPLTPANPLPVPPVGAGGQPPALPSTPPGATGAAFGPGSAKELRAEYAKVQKQLDDLQTKIANGQGATQEAGQASTSENNLISKLNDRLATLAQQITTAESRGPQVVSGGNPTDKYIIRQNPDGTIDRQDNPNWDQKTERAQVVSNGNRIYTVSPEGDVTVAYTDQDAQALAQRQTAVAELNGKTSAAAQATNDYATRARVDLEQRVANGEDAASVRAEQALELQRLHQEWVQADGDARRAQEDLRDYNTERHNSAQEQLQSDQLQATREYQKQQDETLRRGQDLQAQQAAASARNAQLANRTSLVNQRLSSGVGYTGNVFNLLAALNKDAPPGSDAIGAMLMPLLNIGQQFFASMGGMDNPEFDVGSFAPPAAPPAAPSPGVPAPSLPSVSLPSPSLPMPVAPGLPAMVSPAPMVSSGSEGEGNPWAGGNTPPPGTTWRNPAFMAAGGVVTRPTAAVIGESGPEAVVPLSTNTLTPQQRFFATLGAGVLAAQQAAQQQAGPAQQMAAQAAQAAGLPPEAGANPALPGSAVPGVSPQAAAQHARMYPIGPDGSPYVTPNMVAERWALRRGAQAQTATSTSTAPQGAGMQV